MKCKTTIIFSLNQLNNLNQFNIQGLHNTLKDKGILFVSNAHGFGKDQEGWTQVMINIIRDALKRCR